MSQYVPTKQSSVPRVRTGYERVLAHKTRLPFAYPAQQDGKVLAIDETAKQLRIQYKDGEVYVLDYGQQYSNNSGGGFYVTQNVAINGLKVNRKFKRGDILLYNSDFFTADPYSKQVDTNLGYHANVALIEMAQTMEDSCLITADLAAAMRTEPVHVREVVIKASTTVHSIAGVATKLKSADPLMIFDEADIPEDMDSSPDALDIIKRLNRAIKKSKYNGTVVKIEAFYRMPVKDMSPSLGKIVRSISREKNAKAKNAEGAANADEFYREGPMTGDRLGGLDFDEETVLLRFFIQQDLSMEGGDKLVFSASLKSVCAEVTDAEMPTEDGSVKVQGVIAETSRANRMVNTPLRIGVATRIIEKIEQDMLDIYFER